MNDYFTIGERVRIIILELDAFITAICYRKDGYVTYEVSYFSNGEYQQKWMEEFELNKI